MHESRGRRVKSLCRHRQTTFVILLNVTITNTKSHDFSYNIRDKSGFQLSVVKLKQKLSL